jgi:hypothetical protein
MLQLIFPMFSNFNQILLSFLLGSNILFFSFLKKITVLCKIHNWISCYKSKVWVVTKRKLLWRLACQRLKKNWFPKKKKNLSFKKAIFLTLVASFSGPQHSIRLYFFELEWKYTKTLESINSGCSLKSAASPYITAFKTYSDNMAHDVLLYIYTKTIIFYKPFNGFSNLPKLGT